MIRMTLVSALFSKNWQLFWTKSKRLTRQQGFVTSASKSTSKVSNLINVFEKKASTSKTPATPKGKKPPTGFSHLSLVFSIKNCY
jgi:hypothetical protein